MNPDWDAEITRERLSNEELAWMLELPLETVNGFFGAPEEAQEAADEARQGLRESGVPA